MNADVLKEELLSVHLLDKNELGVLFYTKNIIAKPQTALLR